MGETAPATCYICLDELDESDKPTVRNCSCRGDAAGFAHLSCIIKYAEGKSTEFLTSTNSQGKFMEPWVVCPKCHQYYCGQLALELANSSVAYVEREYPGCNWQCLHAYRIKLSRYTTVNDTNRGLPETIEVIKKCLSIIDQLMNIAKIELCG
jgi:ssDNA-binding Zn-finger/Zn-ribbon topoisomerase 1